MAFQPGMLFCASVAASAASIARNESTGAVCMQEAIRDMDELSKCGITVYHQAPAKLSTLLLFSSFAGGLALCPDGFLSPNARCPSRTREQPPFMCTYGSFWSPATNGTEHLLRLQDTTRRKAQIMRQKVRNRAPWRGVYSRQQTAAAP